MKCKRVRNLLAGIGACLLACVVLADGAAPALAAPVVISGKQDDSGTPDTSNVADEGDYIPMEDLGGDEMVPVPASQIAPGTYELDVKSSSSMFRIVNCVLNVPEGAGEADPALADLTLSGTGYLYLYPGTPEEAAAAPEENLIGFTESEDGAYIYMDFPVEGLDQELQCAAFSKRKQQWYGRTVIFESGRLPEDAVLSGTPGEEAEDAASSGESQEESKDAVPEDTLDTQSTPEAADAGQEPDSAETAEVTGDESETQAGQKNPVIWKIVLPVLLVAVIVLWQVLRNRKKK
ncbi:MAG: hypothetical protein IJ860_00495 [Eubacterium sp.]|nr:hypothetical protein [Eubacterium sp.]